MNAMHQYSLRWNNYVQHLKGAFDSLRCDEDLVDVTLSCEGRKIFAHKMLLSACSNYFKDVFKENPCKHPVIIFRGVKFEDLLAVIDFMYHGEVNLEPIHLTSFLAVAEMLAVQGLTVVPETPVANFETTPLMPHSAVLNPLHPTLTPIEPLESGIPEESFDADDDSVVCDTDMNADTCCELQQIKEEQSLSEAGAGHPNDPTLPQEEIIIEKLDQKTPFVRLVRLENAKPSLDSSSLKVENPVTETVAESYEVKTKLSRWQRKISLDESIRISTKGRRYICCFCKKKLANRYSLKNHIRLHVGDSKYFCRLCRKQLSSKESFDNHMRNRIHLGPKNGEMFTCNFCKKKLSRKFILENHIRMHLNESKFSCLLCQKQLSSRRQLKKHIGSHNVNVQRYTCNDCEKQFLDKRYLDDHIQKHLGTGKYVCPHCNKQLAHPSSLKYHIRTHNEGGEKCTCPYCQEEFNYKRHLEKHIRKHESQMTLCELQQRSSLPESVGT